jgi:hypothetical protein
MVVVEKELGLGSKELVELHRTWSTVKKVVVESKETKGDSDR